MLSRLTYEPTHVFMHVDMIVNIIFVVFVYTYVYKHLYMYVYYLTERSYAYCVLGRLTYNHGVTYV